MILLGFFILWSSNAKLGSDPCHDIERKLSKIKDYVSCQSSPKIDACAGVGTHFAGRMEIKKGFRSPGHITYDREATALELAKTWHTTTSSLPFEKLPEEERNAALQRARATLDKMSSEAQGTPQDFAVILTKGSTPATGPIQETAKLGVEEALDRGTKTLSEQQLKILIKYMETAAPTFTRAALTQSIIAPSWKAITQVLNSTMAGVVGGALTEFFGSTTPVGCSTPGDQNVNLDENCRFVYKINEKVLRFLANSKAQKKITGEGEKTSCRFYSNLHSKLFAYPSFSRLNCTAYSDGFYLTVKNSKGVEQKMTVSYYQGTKKIRAVTGSPAGPILVDKDGTIQNYSASYRLNELFALKLYIMDAADCCNAADSNEHKSCLEIYNYGEDTPSPPRLEDLVIQ